MVKQIVLIGGLAPRLLHGWWIIYKVVARLVEFLFLEELGTGLLMLRCWLGLLVLSWVIWLLSAGVADFFDIFAPSAWPSQFSLDSLLDSSESPVCLSVFLPTAHFLCWYFVVFPHNCKYCKILFLLFIKNLPIMNAEELKDLRMLHNNSQILWNKNVLGSILNIGESLDN